MRQPRQCRTRHEKCLHLVFSVSHNKMRQPACPQTQSTVRATTQSTRSVLPPIYCKETTTKRGQTAGGRQLASGVSAAYSPQMEAAVAYQFHIVLRDISPKIWRRVELTAGNSLADLQRVIQICFGWSDEYLHRFCIRNHHLGASPPGGLLFFGDPEEMTLIRFAFRQDERFTYEYNFFDEWIIDIRFEGEHALDTRCRYPRCIAGARRAPPEDSGGTEEFMDRQVPESADARKTRELDRKLREVAQILREPALDGPARVRFLIVDPNRILIVGC
jgi:hypothetical protein